MAQKSKSKTVIHPKARERMLDIWSYTYEQWSEKQANKYIEDLHYYIESLSTHKYLWRPVPHAEFAGIYFIRYEFHFVFFREFEDGTIGILSVLHESMDIPERLFEDTSSDL